MVLGNSLIIQANKNANKQPPGPTNIPNLSELPRTVKKRSSDVNILMQLSKPSQIGFETISQSKKLRNIEAKIGITVNKKNKSTNGAINKQNDTSSLNILFLVKLELFFKVFASFQNNNYPLSVYCCHFLVISLLASVPNFISISLVLLSFSTIFQYA